MLLLNAPARRLPQAPLEDLLRVCLSKQDLAHVLNGPHTLVKVEQLGGSQGPPGYGMQVGGLLGCFMAALQGSRD